MNKVKAKFEYRLYKVQRLSFGSLNQSKITALRQQVNGQGWKRMQL